MSEELGAPQIGDVFHQRAIILTEKGTVRKSYELQVSDEHGVIAGEPKPDLNKVMFFADNFAEQFSPDPDKGDGIFLSRVKIIELDSERNEIVYRRIKNDGRLVEVASRLKRNKFLKTFFLPYLK